ncbi:cytidylyltransferase domain-containing protein [Shewanella sp. YLB-07]|uniref:acylneuraminate cytidylyltransferase family protein n=1 Tax=Shewanella sp. YLB-07 TaxID=2601268 RepID=UPI00128DFDB9|nr:acylneuraminate cytidylyltransferase family protein [Shewanella sp. YLB-07]MPY24866.1 acylneuraminate cytidylyltransferase family protein [Shewanella sp. YLB-07]
MTVALITARGGSKGLPRKNILPLNGVELIGWSIKAALQCSQIKQVFVSTEDEEIAEVSLKYGAKIIRRPEQLASDMTNSESVIEHAISWLEQQNIFCKDMVLLQPTSPLRNSKHLNEALNLFYTKSADCVISVFEPCHTPIKAYIENDDGSIIGLYNDMAPYSRRQDLPRAFQPNGAIYAFSIEKFKRKNHIPRNNVFPYIMSESDSADIDTLDDLIKVEQRMKEMNK